MSKAVKNHCDAGQSLMPLEQALDELKARANPIKEFESVALQKSLGRVLAQDLVSAINVPPAANSAMDGYAVRAKDLDVSGKTKLAISQRICAGETGKAHTLGTAARIFTGAPIPRDADAVMMQENCEVSDDGVILYGQLQAGDNVRQAGEDILMNTVVLERGQKLRAQDIGLAASIGMAKLPVYKRLKVAVFFTGDELCDPGDTPKSGQIYNSNRYTLTGLLESLACEVIDLGNIKDTLKATVSAMQNAAQQADLVMTSGGVSVGEEDHVRKALEWIGQLNMWRVNIKPGKPFAFGEINSQSKSTPFIGLPGNPVSVFATFCIFARPYILACQGLKQTEANSFSVASNFDLDGRSRNEYLRVRLAKNDQGQATLDIYPNQSSGVLSSASWATGFAFIPANIKIQQGDMLKYMPFSEFSII